MRADAQHNVARIVAAAARQFAAQSDPSLAAIAEEAGVSRVTLYAHFPDRDSLLDAAIRYVIEEVERAVAAAVRADHDEWGELDAMIGNAWLAGARYRGLILAVGVEGPVHARHKDAIQARTIELLTRGRRSGAFRTDQPVVWQVTLVQDLMVSAARLVESGGLTVSDVPGVMRGTLRAALRATGGER